MLKRHVLSWLAGAALAVATSTCLTACSKDSPNFTAIDITGADYGRDFTLVDHNGQRRSLKDFRGKIVMMFFGYTQCPDVCPTSMVEMATIKQQLGADGDKLQALFVTVDPERDTAEMLKAYMENFDPTFLALVPTQAELPVVSKEYKVYYKKVEGPTPTSYTLDHTAGSYVYDTQGRLRLFTRYGTPPDKTVADIRVLLRQAG